MMGRYRQACIPRDGAEDEATGDNHLILLGDRPVPESYDAIKAAVEQNGNVLTIPMLRLREAIGAGKLGNQITGQISKDLAGMGLAHVPIELPQYQDKLVRLYKLGTAVCGCHSSSHRARST